MEITRQEVEKVAKLARLAMTEAETAAYSQQLNQIVAYVQKLKTCPDEVHPSLSENQALGNAPDAEAHCFRVPKIIQES